jgi:hypothetical protein
LGKVGEGDLPQHQRLQPRTLQRFFFDVGKVGKIYRVAAKNISGFYQNKLDLSASNDLRIDHISKREGLQHKEKSPAHRVT